eukprot:SAG31_NODE_21067_length_558_cov_1.287582_1_plen_88_part_00
MRCVVIHAALQRHLFPDAFSEKRQSFGNLVEFAGKFAVLDRLLHYLRTETKGLSQLGLPLLNGVTLTNLSLAQIVLYWSQILRRHWI